MGWRATLVMVLLLAGCAGGEPGPPPAPTGPAAGAQVMVVGADERLPAATMVVLPPPAREDAGDPPVAGRVVEALQRLGRPIGEVEEVGEREARFVDARLAGDGARVELRNGGVVEIQERAATRPSPSLLANLNPLAPATAEPALTQGRILLRLSPRMPDAAVRRYAAALHRIRG